MCVVASDGLVALSIDFIFASGNRVGIKLAMKVCRSGDRIVLLKDIKLARLLILAFERA
jgi:hypothetical protein